MTVTAAPAAPTSAAPTYGYAVPVVYHDGHGNQYSALIYSTRTDLKNELGPDGEPVCTLIYLDPTMAPKGPQRGDFADAIAFAFDVPYLATEELYTRGYNEATYVYPAAPAVDPLTQIASIQTQLTAVKAQVEAEKAASIPVTTAPVKTASSTTAPASPAKSAAAPATSPTAPAAETVDVVKTTLKAADKPSFDQSAPAPVEPVAAKAAAPTKAGLSFSAAKSASID
jgi:hypothetical protein